LFVANNGGTGGVLQQELSSQPVLTSAFPLNPLEALSPYTVIHMLSKNFKESQDFSQDSSNFTPNIRSKSVCALQKGPRNHDGSKNRRILAKTAACAPRIFIQSQFAHDKKRSTDS
jgi:hypothetical protein